jgi:acyl phosphate:glycerol-3-phosphate acyltransferase
MAETTFWMPLLAMAALGYLLGSIPFGIVLTRLTGGPDLRSVGSGNIGATNVLRTGNKGLAAATLLGDGLKGTLAVLIGAAFGPVAALCAAIGAFLGHLFPVWLRFRGGKGVATFLGCLLALKWPVGLAFIAIWLGVAFVSRYSSLAALAASAATPLMLWTAGQPAMTLAMAGLAALLWVMHRENIARLLAGTEGRIGKDKTKAAAP